MRPLLPYGRFLCRFLTGPITEPAKELVSNGVLKENDDMRLSLWSTADLAPGCLNALWEILR